MDKAHLQTNKNLELLERKLNNLYTESIVELKKTFNEYNNDLIDFEKRNDVGDLDQKSKNEYDELLHKLSHSRKMIISLTDEQLKINLIALEIINDMNVNTYLINRNYELESISKEIGVDFTIYNKNILKGLLEENPKLLPISKLDKNKDSLWNQKQIQLQIISGIQQGLPIDKIANSLEKIAMMNRNSSIRIARTLTTQTQNKARVDEMQDMNLRFKLDMKKQWLSTSDSRTRDSHILENGTIVELDEDFPNVEIPYPGHFSGKPEEIYNCRCTLKHVIPKIEEIRRKNK